MCIAIVKPIGAEIPSKKILRDCWDNNPDGAGLMYNDGQGVVIHKGFTKFKGFYKYLQKLNEQVDLTDKDLVLHFRIATSGGVNRECTHPFPVTNDIAEMKKLDNVCKYGFAHNGIIQGYGSKDFSDTMEYISTVISKIKGIEESEALLNALACEHASRFVVLTKDDFELGGDWIKDGDCYFSNGSYKPYYYTSKWSNVDWKKWEELEDSYFECSERCECCDALCYKDDIIKTGYGNICKWCYEELLGAVEDKEEEKQMAL